MYSNLDMSSKIILYSSDRHEYKTLGTIKDIELSSSIETDKKALCYFKSSPCEFTASIPQGIFPLRFLAYIITGKKLFLKCPKKIRRSRKWKSIIDTYKVT